MTKETKCKILYLVAEIRTLLPYITPEERIEIFSDVKSGYCHSCGNKSKDGSCNCERDE